MIQSRNVREGRYAGCKGGKHVRFRGECLRYRVSTSKWYGWALRNGYIAFIDPVETHIQDHLKGQRPYPKSDMEGELGQMVSVRFVTDSQRAREYAERTKADFAERTKRAIEKLPGDPPSGMIGP